MTTSLIRGPTCQDPIRRWCLSAASMSSRCSADQVRGLVTACGDCAASFQSGSRQSRPTWLRVVWIQGGQDGIPCSGRSGSPGRRTGSRSAREKRGCRGHARRPPVPAPLAACPAGAAQPLLPPIGGMLSSRSSNGRRSRCWHQPRRRRSGWRFVPSPSTSTGGGDHLGRLVPNTLHAAFAGHASRRTPARSPCSRGGRLD